MPGRPDLAERLSSPASGTLRLVASTHNGKGGGEEEAQVKMQVGSDVRPWKYREESSMRDEQAAPETKGVTAALLNVNLGPEMEGMAGRQLRMRMVTIEPGGVFGHSRP